MTQAEARNPTGSSPRNAMRRLGILAGLLLAAAFTLACFIPALPGPFTLDDHINVVHNSNIRMDAPSWEALKEAARLPGTNKRPAAGVSFALSYWASGLDPAGFRAVNIALHVLTGLVLFGLFRATLNLAAPDMKTARADAASLFAALLWMVHPLQTQSVSYIVQRMNVMASLFFAGALLLYTWGRTASRLRVKTGCFTGAAAAFALGLGSKETVIMLPLAVCLYEWVFFQGGSASGLKKMAPWIGLAGGAAVLAGLLHVGASPLEWLASTYEGRTFTMGQRLLTQGRVMGFYALLLICPLPRWQNLDYDFTLSTGWLDPPLTLACMAILGAAAVWAACGARKRPLAAFAIMWLLLNMILESSAAGLEIIFEHRMYTPSMFFFLAAAHGAFSLGRPTRQTAAALAAAALVLGFFTVERNRLYGDGAALWLDVVDKSPNKLRGYNHLGFHLLEKGRPEEMLRATAPGVRKIENGNIPLRPPRLKTLASDLYNMRGCALESLDRKEEAAESYGKSLAMNPGNAAARRSLMELSRILSIKRTQAEAGRLTRQGLDLMRDGNLAAAGQCFAKALEQAPEDIPAHYNMACLASLAGREEEALFWMEKAIALGFRDLDRITLDSDFDNVRNSPGFQQLMKEGRQ